MFSITTVTAYPLKQDCRVWLLHTNYSLRQFCCLLLNQCHYQYQFYSRIRVCDFWGLTCSPCNSMIMEFTLLRGIKIMHQVYLLSSLFFTYIFGKVVVTTAFYIFSVVITTDPHWRLLVFCIFLMR